MRQSAMTASHIYETVSLLKNNVQETQEALEKTAAVLGKDSTAYRVIKDAHVMAETEFTNFINKTFREY
jgi:hypothetical protein